METDQTCSHPDKVDGSTPRPYDTVAGYNRKFYKTVIDLPPPKEADTVNSCYKKAFMD